MTDKSTFDNCTVEFHTLGCKLNFAETSTIGKILAERGIRRAQVGETPDICVVTITETFEGSLYGADITYTVSSATETKVYRRKPILFNVNLVNTSATEKQKQTQNALLFVVGFRGFWKFCGCVGKE